MTTNISYDYFDANNEFTWTRNLLKIGSLLFALGMFFFSSSGIINLINYFGFLQNEGGAFVVLLLNYLYDFFIFISSIILIIGLHKLSKSNVFSNTNLFSVAILLLSITFLLKVIYTIIESAFYFFQESLLSKVILVTHYISFFVFYVILSTVTILINQSFIIQSKLKNPEIKTMISSFIYPVLCFIIAIFIIIIAIVNTTNLIIITIFYISLILLGINGILFASELNYNLNKTSH